MKKFQARFISEAAGTDLGLVSAMLDLEFKQPIDNLLWSENGYKPGVSFCMAYTSDSILLKYYVNEKYTQANYRQANDPVYKDSCVEAFIAFNKERYYYNLEFNSLGTALAGYGADKMDRTLINHDLVKQITSHHQLFMPEIGAGELIEWELTLNIPFVVFSHHHITSLKSQVCAVNFYKCGDDLPEPHFLSWNNLEYPSPEFHLPQFFGEVQFIT